MWKSIRNSVFRFATPCFTFFRNKIILTMIYSFLHLIYSFVSFRFIGFVHSCTFKTQLWMLLFHLFFFHFTTYFVTVLRKLLFIYPRTISPFHVYQLSDDQKFQPVSISTNIFAVFSHNR